MLRLWVNVQTGMELQADGNHRVLPFDEWGQALKQLGQLSPMDEQ